MILVVDYGSQYTQLLARRIREAGAFSEIVPFAKLGERLAQMQPPNASLTEEHHDKLMGVILSGGPNSVYAEGAPRLDPKVFELGVPVLGVCYGMQLMMQHFGGEVRPAPSREYGREKIHLQNNLPASYMLSIYSDSQQIRDEKDAQVVWMSHGDEVAKVAPGFSVACRSEAGAIAAVIHESQPFMGLQFHPEVKHSVLGFELIKRFVRETCQIKDVWDLGHEAERIISLIQQEVDSKVAQGSGRNVVCALSGGVDSTVAAVLATRALGDRVHCVFVDNGLLRKNEYESVLESFRKNFNLNVRGIDAKSEFLSALKGLEDPELKRKAIGKTFIEIFEGEAKAIGDVGFLVQGTLYTDVIESVSIHGTSVTIKSHHNVGGLPEVMQLSLIEPLRELFKDEVRRLGESLGIGHAFLWRHPFPGPGLAIRVLGEVNEESLSILREADSIFISELKESGLYDEVWQAFSVFLPVRAVGVMGDGRTYENVIALRAVTSSDGMTADWARLPYEFLGKVSNRVVNEVRGVNRVVYDISSKPPATIEWE